MESLLVGKKGAKIWFPGRRSGPRCVSPGPNIASESPQLGLKVEPSTTPAAVVVQEIRASESCRISQFSPVW